MKASLRPARTDDLPAIAAVYVAAAQVGWAYLAPVATLVPSVEEWAPRLEAAEEAAVAIVAGKVVGFAFTRGCELEFLFTHPRAWGQGAGRALLAHAEDVLRAAGCGEAVLWTEERNERALHVYAAAGWEPDGAAKERVWMGAPLRELRLRKRLRG
jgi:GNAT superfamily N-acetyltransferase